jgi:hypothetical protein
MLLARLIAGLAKRQAKPKPIEHGPLGHTGTIAFPGHLPGATDEPVPLRRDPNGFAGPIAVPDRLPGEPAVAALYADQDELEAFLALPPAQQIAAIEAELAQLPAAQQRLVAEILKKELARKWLPLPGPQTAALQSQADILLYGGAGGGGKSATLLGLALTEHKRSLIMRRQYTDLRALTDELIKFNGTRNGFNGSAPPSLRTDDGRLIEFGAAAHAGDEQSFQGQPHDFLGVDEAAQFLESQVRFLMGWVRSTEEGQRTRVVLATNPPLSDEGQWLVAMFAPWLDPQHPNPAKPGELRWYVTDEAGDDLEVDGPGPHMVGGREVRALSRTFIPAKLSDNPYLARTDYAAKLDALQEPLRSAVRDGNFMAVRSDDAWQVIPSEWIRLAQARWTPRPPPGQDMTCIALDPAGGGKDAGTIAHRYGTWFGPVLAEKGPQTADGRFMGARVLMERRNNCQVVVDVGGGYGSEAVTTLKDNEAPVLGFRGSDASTGKSIGSGLSFANMRAEVWWRFREALDPQSPDPIALPPDQELAADLATPRLNARAMQVRGVIQVEDKEDIRKRLGRSPDKGDAVVTCWPYGGLLQHERKANPRLPTMARTGYAAQKKFATARR